jgi:hypothetical protein
VKIFKKNKHKTCRQNARIQHAEFGPFFYIIMVKLLNLVLVLYFYILDFGIFHCHTPSIHIF